jgi:prepilin-type N-terminal cleavage/methylation domain-containing protein
MRFKAFTLIELLIVVAIIAILAAIAVPNFLEAQVRAKVSRCKADQRTFATAIESYVVDNNKYFPPINAALARSAAPTLSYTGPSAIGSSGGFNQCVSCRFIWITTPIAYATSIFREPFEVGGVAAGAGVAGDDPREYDTYDYWMDHAPTNIAGTTFIAEGAGISSGCKWRVAGVGPDRKACFGGTALSGGRANAEANAGGCTYDPSNGTVSSGDIIRCGPPSEEGTVKAFYDRGKNPNI